MQKQIRLGEFYNVTHIILTRGYHKNYDHLKNYFNAEYG